MLLVVTVTTGLFFVMNIGASGAASFNGHRLWFGCRSESNGLAAVWNCCFLGAWLGGSCPNDRQLYGIPVPLTEIATSSIIEIGFAKHGKAVLKKDIVVQMIPVWAVSPVLSMVLCYTLIPLLMEQNGYPIAAMGGVMISVYGVHVLMKKTIKGKVDSNVIFAKTPRRNTRSEV